MAETGSATPPLLRRMNAARVLDVLRTDGPSNVAELARRVGQSRATLDAIVEDLIRIGLVAQIPNSERDGARGRGRPPRRLRFRAEAGHVAGIDIGAHRVRVMVTDLLGSVVANRERTVHPDTSRAQRLRTVRQCASTALREAGPDPTDPRTLRTIGVATPGIVDSETGTVIYCNAMANWSGLPLAAELEQAFGCAVTVENDANLAAMGECWKGVAYGHDDVVFLLAGDRIGAGIVIGGELVRGRRGGTGELTFLGLLSTPNPNQGIEQHVPSVVHATVQQLISRGELTGGAVRALVHDLAPLHGVQIEDVDELLAAAQRRDRSARRRLETALAQVCRVVIVMTTLISPELLVIGGSAPAAADVILPPIRTLLDGLAGPGVEPPHVTTSTLGESAVALGAVRKALDTTEPTLLEPLG